MLNWRQTFFMRQLHVDVSREPTRSGAFGLPANGDDSRRRMGRQRRRVHRAGGMFNMQPIRNLGVSVNLRAQSGTPYNVTTGVDDNGDGVFNDRPAGAAQRR